MNPVEACKYRLHSHGKNKYIATVDFNLNRRVSGQPRLMMTPEGIFHPTKTMAHTLSVNFRSLKWSYYVSTIIHMTVLPIFAKIFPCRALQKIWAEELKYPLVN